MSISGCDRHPSLSPVTGFCPSCLNDRLSYLTDPDLRRSKSHSSSKHLSSSASILCRKSCDSRPRTSLSHLFQSDDTNDNNDRISPVLIRSNKLRSKEKELDKTLVENEEDNQDDEKSMKEYIEITDIINHKSYRNLSRFGKYLGVNEVEDDDGEKRREEHVEITNTVTGKICRNLSNFDKELGENEVELEEEEEEKDAKPMKEHIEIELENHSKRHSGLWGGIFTQKLLKWRLKQQQNRKKVKQPIDSEEGFKAESVVGRRRSCDTEPRFSVEENTSRVSFDEPRASWDGYMMARTIPRLAPMLSVIENQMVVEDETNSISESSSSARRNSFDCSSSGKSSGKNRAHVEIDDLKMKVVDTGRLEVDTYEDHSKSSVSAPKNSGSLKKKMLRILGFKSKSTETQEIGDLEIGRGHGVANEVSSGNVLRRKSDVGSYKMLDLYRRSPNVGEIRGHVTPFDRTRSVRYSPSPINFENGLLRFHLTPPLSRKKKPERRSSILNSQSNARGGSRIS